MHVKIAKKTMFKGSFFYILKRVNHNDLKKRFLSMCPLENARRPKCIGHNTCKSMGVACIM